jgi:Xaa-Pro aminopeptidase
MDKTTETASRLTRLRDWMVGAGLDGLIVPRADAHQSEVTAPRDDCLAYVTGFTGSAGLALVLRDRAIIFVDGRYQVQVRQQVDLDTYAVRHLRDEPIDQWLREQAQPGWVIGTDPMKLTLGLHDALSSALAERHASLHLLEQDPFDAVWTGRPPVPLGKIRAMPVEMAGETSASKRQRIAERLRATGADLMVETLPDNIAWLLNVRGSDVAMNPVPHSFLTLDAGGGVEWFVDSRKLGNDRAAYEIADVTLGSPERFLDRITELSDGKSVVIDKDFASQALRSRIEAGGGEATMQANPTTIAKAAKTNAELAGFRACHIEDGAALTDFLAWVANEAPARQHAQDPLTELEAEARLHAFRAERQDFLEDSFRSISASSGNAAMCHYAASPRTNAVIDTRAPYLIDSGGQYLNGTTDVTRTLMLGQPTDAMRLAYTAVLKGFLSLLSARFPTGTQGHQLDAFARRALWDVGLDYDHGTGHGVGHNLLMEVDQLDSYHAEVRSMLEALVRPETLPFLIEQTRPIAERARCEHN